MSFFSCHTPCLAIYTDAMAKIECYTAKLMSAFATHMNRQAACCKGLFCRCVPLPSFAMLYCC